MPRWAPKTDLERLMEKINIDPLTQCWIWKSGNRHKYSYPYFYLNRKYYIVKRASWLINIGNIPPDKDVTQKCDNTLCVNPVHLILENKINTLARGFK